MARMILRAFSNDWLPECARSPFSVSPRSRDRALAERQGAREIPSAARKTRRPRLRVKAFGLDFPNPLGLAAGFDKHGEVPDAILRLGFSFTEVGTVTPLPQGGNPRPRLFRLTRDEAVINRFGFNSEGHAAVHARLSRRAERPGIVGINIGANKDTPDRAADYVRGIEAFADLAT